MTAVFEWPIRVYIEDTDAGGIVYYVNYLKFIERARTEFMRNLGFGKKFLLSADSMFVVHSSHSEFLKPARLDDALIATAEVIKTGKAYLSMQQKVYRLDPDSDNYPGGDNRGRDNMTSDNMTDDNRELLCRFEVKLACVDKDTIKPRRIPEQMLAAIAINGG